jgi:hypothetical protein
MNEASLKEAMTTIRALRQGVRHWEFVEGNATGLGGDEVGFVDRGP